MAKITMHKSSDGVLHETAKACNKHEVAQRVLKASESYADFIVPYDDFDDRTTVQVESLPLFIAQNADALRKILNDALIVKRPRKAKKEEVTT